MATKTLFDLADKLEGDAAKLNKAASDAAVFMAETIVSELAYKTPVDTSQALSSWIVTLDTPSTDTNFPHYYGEFGSSQASSAAETIRQAKEALKNKKPGQDIYITNNQPYIVRLNEGSSQQQPAGFIERAVLVGKRALSKRKFLKNG